MVDNTPKEPPLSLRLFGDFEIRAQDRPLPPFRSRKENWLLALLALQKGREVRRDWVAQTLWPFPDHAEDMARNYLRRSLWLVSKALGAEAERIEKPTPKTLRLLLNEDELDVARFDRLTGGANAIDLDALLAIYCGPLLRDCTEDWVYPERERRHHLFCEALLKGGYQALEQGDTTVALRYFQHAIQADPFLERARRGQLETLALSRDLSGFGQAYQEFRTLLHNERNARPSSEMAALFDRLNASLRQSLRAPETAPVSAPPPVVAPQSQKMALPDSETIPDRSLPAFSTELIEREEELTEVIMRLRNRRLVTLTGPGGVGKTRLAVQTARQLRDEFPDGVYFIDLAAVSRDAQVASAVASVLGLRDPSSVANSPYLINYLKRKRLLIVLDNCEHLITACAQLATDILNQCSEICLLATSRQSLGIAEETAWCVPSLSVPDPSRLAGDRDDLPGVVRRIPAVRLFLQRAVAARPEFELTAENARTVAEICHYLDGIPLAIEVAAARLRILTAQEVRERLEQRFGLLALSNPLGVSRHRSLRTAVAWSYDLLPEEERQALSRFTIFQGGFTLEAAMAVCSEEQEDPETLWEKMADRLERLVDKSLMVAVTTPYGTRYRLQEPIRQYCAERLLENQRAEPASASANHRLMERFAAHYARFVEKAAEQLRGAKQAEWIGRIDADYENLLKAMHWSLEQGTTDYPVAQHAWMLVASLCHYWDITRRTAEARQFLGSVLKLPDPIIPTLRVRALVTAALMADFQRYVAEGVRLAAEAVSRAHLIGDPHTIAHALKMHGWLSRHDNPDYTTRLLEQTLEISRAVNDHWLTADTLSTLGFHELYLGKYDRIQSLFEEGLREARATADPRLINELVYHLGLAAITRGAYREASGLLREALEMNRQMGNRPLVANRVYHLANCFLHMGDIDMAETFFREALIKASDHSLRRAVLASLEGIACVAVERGQGERAVRLFAVAETLGAATERPLFPAWGTRRHLYLERARALLDPESFSVAWTRGQMIPEEQATRFALEGDSDYRG